MRLIDADQLKENIKLRRIESKVDITKPLAIGGNIYDYIMERIDDCQTITPEEYEPYIKELMPFIKNFLTTLSLNIADVLRATEYEAGIDYKPPRIEENAKAEDGQVTFDEIIGGA